MPSTPVMGNGKQRSSAVQEGDRRFAWLTEKRLVSALSAKQDYEVRDWLLGGANHMTNTHLNHGEPHS